MIDNNLVQKLGIVFMKFDSADSLKKFSADMQELIKVVTRPAGE